MKKTIQIEGMSCPHCANAVKEALEALQGVASATVALAEKTAAVETENTDDSTLISAIEAIGFEAAIK